MKRKSFLMTVIILISVSVALTPSFTKADILVYDNNDQYLGILLDLSYVSFKVFIPSLGASLPISSWGGVGQSFYLAFYYFDSTNCSGTPYASQPLPEILDFSSTPFGGIRKPDYNGRRTFSPESDYSSEIGCTERSSANDEYVPITPVQLPFTTPIALPLRFEVETLTVTQTEIMPFPIVVTPKNK